MSDTNWLKRQGFEDVEQLPSGFSLLVKKINSKSKTPKFNTSVKSGQCPHRKGLVAYYSNRCPFAEFHAKQSLTETAKARNLPLKLIKLKTMRQAQSAPSPATIFSLFYNGKFLTTDIGACMDARFDRMLEKAA